MKIDIMTLSRRLYEKHIINYTADCICNFFSMQRIKLQKYPSETCTKLPDEQTFKVITDKCSLCHSKDFETKELICARKSMITDAVQSGRMPKFKKLSDEELKIILKWGM
jgi:hypothetical protein